MAEYFQNSQILRNFVAVKWQKSELSILIPAYNTVCVNMVAELQKQAEALGIDYEIIVVDDASPLHDTVRQNRVISDMPRCTFIAKQQNSGSAATRNELTAQSRYRWLLFLDCDMQIPDSRFLERYVSCQQDGVINGGISIGGNPTELKHCLRYRYEKREEPNHTAEKRQLRPYQSFRSTNFLAARDVMLRCPFDERFKRSGYEDVLLGKSFKQQKVTLTHIDNPLVMTDYEKNTDYVVKIERSLETLHAFRRELRGYSRLLTLADGIHIAVVRQAIALAFRLCRPLMRRNLCGSRPNLKLFDIYRIGYFLTLKTVF